MSFGDDTPSTSTALQVHGGDPAELSMDPTGADYSETAGDYGGGADYGSAGPGGGPVGPRLGSPMHTRGVLTRAKDVATSPVTGLFAGLIKGILKGFTPLGIASLAWNAGKMGYDAMTADKTTLGKESGGGKLGQ
jgi:hypothetical protein